MIYRGNAILGAVSGIAGAVIGSLVTKNRITKKYTKEKKELLQFIQLQEELYKQQDAQWRAEYTKLYNLYAELEKETVERDYEEFKAPDTDNDDKISREEFSTYVTKYLSSFPELSAADFPTFDEFDLDHDGTVSFDEWQTFLYQQKLKEATTKNNKKSTGSDDYNNLLDALYESTNTADNFNSLNQNIAKNSNPRANAKVGNANANARR